jgi:hypothetical protein
MLIAPVKRRRLLKIIACSVNIILCGIARATIALCSYQRIAPWFGHFYHMTVASTLPSAKQHRRAVMLKRSIQLAAQYTPWNSSCLTQAMVAKFWCQFFNLPYMFFIGLLKNSDKPLGKEAHAWVTCGSVAITGGHGFESHHVILSYSSIKRDP